MEFQQEFILLTGTPIGDIQIRYYGIIIVFAMLVAATLAARLAKRAGLDPDHIWGGLTWAIIPGIILARLWFVLFPPAALTAGCGSAAPDAVCKDTIWFLQNFFNTQEGAIAIWSGGLSIFGAVIGGGLGAYLYMRRHQLKMGPWLDIAAVVMPLGQAIGRWANFVNQELYGGPTTLPWGLSIDREHRVAPFNNMTEFDATTRFHPLFLYEALWNFLAFIVLLNLYQRNKNRFKPGDFFLIYIMQYSFIRFLLEFVRVEVAYLPGTTINSSQVATLLAFVAALVLFLRRRGQTANSEPVTKAASVAAENAE